MATKMVSELKNLSCAERTEESGLPALQERRERGDLITMLKLVNNMERIDREDQVIKMEEEEGCTRGYRKKLMSVLRRQKKYSFPH